MISWEGLAMPQLREDVSCAFEADAYPATVAMWVLNMWSFSCNLSPMQTSIWLPRICRSMRVVL